MQLFHGSDKIIRQPIYGEGSVYNDYGQGFYCTKDAELAKEWACKTRSDGYANEYLFDEAGLRILDLTSADYSILHWICILVEHRQFELNTPIQQSGYEWLVSDYHINLDPYDVIVGYRADDSYFSFARAFLSNQISIQQLQQAMELGELGIQYVLVSEKAFDALRYENYEIAPCAIYYAKRMTRDQKARDEYRKIVADLDFGGDYIRDLMR